MENIAGSAIVRKDVSYDTFLKFGFVQEEKECWTHYLYREYTDKNGALSKIIVDKDSGKLWDCFASSYGALFNTFNLLCVADLSDACLIDTKELPSA